MILSVALLIKSFDLTVLILMPYSVLSRGLAPAERSVRSNALGKLSVVALFLSMKKWHLGAALSTRRHC